jgi:hypothetical protein
MIQENNTPKSLSIRISTDGLAFCVYTPNSEPHYTYKRWQVKPIMSMAANLKEALTNEPILHGQFQRVNVLISTPQFTTLPVMAFQRDKIEDVFQFVFPKTQNYHVTYNLLRRSGVAIIFGIDQHVRQLILDDYPRARFYAAASTLSEFLSEKSLIGSHRKMYVYLHEGEMTLYCFNKGLITFANTYSVKGVNDCQYYILNVWQQLHYDQLDDTLAIISDEADASPLADKLLYFIKDTKLIQASEDFRDTLTANESNNMPYDLQTLLVCGF